MADEQLIIRIVNGQWYATQGGKHLTAQQTAALIARGVPYIFDKEE